MVFNFGSCYGLLASGNGRGHPGEGSIRTFKWLLRMECDAFRVCNAPRAFTRLIDLVLKDLHWQICLIYLDDVIVMGRTFGEELERWKQVFERLSRAGLKLKPMKTFVFQKQKWVLFLKHVVTGGSHREGIAVDPAKVEQVCMGPTLGNSVEVKSFLGLASYYRWFVHDFLTVAVQANSSQHP